MEPLSILGLGTSIVQTIDVIARTISALRGLQRRWKSTDMTISQLIGLLNTLKAALNQISGWVSGSLEDTPQYYRLVMDLLAATESCNVLISFLDDYVSGLEWDDKDNLTLQSKIKAFLQDIQVKDCVNHLGNQVAAFNLLLTAINW
jgi:hypothetical protein